MDDYDERETESYTSLHWAARDGKIRQSRKLLASGAEKEARTSKLGRTPFHIAVVSGQEEMVDVLIEEKCNFRAKDREGNNSLALAILNGHLKIVRNLIIEGLLVNDTYKNGATPLHLASAKGCVHISKYLISRDANIEARNSMNGRTPFLEAVYHNQCEMVRFLMKKGCNVFAKDRICDGAVALASQRGHSEMLECLKKILVPRNINSANRNGYTSLHWAAESGSLEAVSLLCSNGANPTASDHFDRTPFLVSVLSGHIGIAKYLGSRSDIHAKDNKGRSALSLACQSGHVAVATWLVSKKEEFSVEELDYEGFTALHLAAQAERFSVIEYLLSCEANIEAQDKRGFTPFLVAVESGNDGVLDLLASNGCNVHAKTKQDEGALDIAVQNDKLELLERLVHWGLTAGELGQETRGDVNRMAEEHNTRIESCFEEANELRRKLDQIMILSLPSAPIEKCGFKSEAALEVLEQIRLLENGDAAAAADKERIEELQSRVDYLNHELETLRNRLEESARESQLLVQTSKSQILEMQSQLDAVRNNSELELAEVTKAADGEKTRILEREENLRLQAEEERNRAHEMNRAKDGEIEALREEIRALRREKDQAQISLEREVEEKREARGQLDESRVQCNQLREEKDEIQGVADEKGESLRRSRELLQIPLEDVRMTGIKLGGGAYGEVKMGYWRGCYVAVKIMHELLHRDHYLDLFQQEVGMCSHVHHPNVVSLCGVTTEDDVPVRIITELLEGSVSDVIKASLRSPNRLSLREQVDMATGFTAGITYLHQLGPSGILHGDIRPSNIVVTSLMEAKICDLGASRFAEASRRSAGPMSPQYLAPERTPEAGHRNTKKADIYSLGVTLIELMTGQQAAVESRQAHLTSVGHEDIKRLGRQMIKTDPSQRPSAQDCLSALETVGESVDYNACPPKRLVKGKLHGENEVRLVDEPWQATLRPF